jgi:hypothetical protein
MLVGVKSAALLFDKVASVGIRLFAAVLIGGP